MVSNRINRFVRNLISWREAGRPPSAAGNPPATQRRVMPEAHRAPRGLIRRRIPSGPLPTRPQLDGAPGSQTCLRRSMAAWPNTGHCCEAVHQVWRQVELLVVQHGAYSAGTRVRRRGVQQQLQTPGRATLSQRRRGLLSRVFRNTGTQASRGGESVLPQKRWRAARPDRSGFAEPLAFHPTACQGNRATSNPWPKMERDT
jgi:hypothetical protein